MNLNEQFQWQCQPLAEQALLEHLQRLKELYPCLQDFEKKLEQITSTRLFDWIDHFVLKRENHFIDELTEAGFTVDAEGVFSHPGAQLPRVAFSGTGREAVAVSVESVADFLMVHGLKREIIGSPFNGYRQAEVNPGFLVIERQGYSGMVPNPSDPGHVNAYLTCREKWQTRPRHTDDEGMMEAATALAKEIASTVGQDMAAWIVLDVERKYWQARNLAGQLQKDRQDRLGMGWANHDHHTFRSSRKYFKSLVQLFEILGFHCRERFYAGAEAGWGAQVMENPRARLVLFLDVDLDPQELEIDFAHTDLPELPRLGTIGLWCALHGDSIFQAGMHHLEAQFLFEQLTEDLQTIGVGMMKPFSSFPYLKQAFTKGEIWAVDPNRLDLLLKKGKISSEQKEKFALEGALGSHLENLQRREGYKGFNQKNVSFIIRETDPRSIKPGDG